MSTEPQLPSDADLHAAATAFRAAASACDHARRTKSPVATKVLIQTIAAIEGLDHGAYSTLRRLRQWSVLALREAGTLWDDMVQVTVDAGTPLSRPRLIQIGQGQNGGQKRAAKRAT